MIVGGALALHYSLRSMHQLAGYIALRAWLPLRADYPDAISTASRSLPVLQVHGDEDMIINHAWSKAAASCSQWSLTPPLYLSP